MVTNEGAHPRGRQVRDRSRQHPGRAQEDHQPAGEVRDQHAPSRRSQRRQRQAAGAWARRSSRRGRRARTWWTATSRGCRTSPSTTRPACYLGGKRVDLFYFGRAHTNGDIVALFPAQRVLAAGDMFTVGDATPQLVDYPGGGSAKEWPHDARRRAGARLRSGRARPRHRGDQGRDAEVPRHRRAAADARARHDRPEEVEGRDLRRC